MAVHQIGNFAIPVIRCSLVIVVLALLAPFICFNFPFVHSKYQYMNDKCKVYFNYTHYHQDRQDFYLNQLFKIRRSCVNDTVKIVGRKLTRNELFDCLDKCNQVADGFANKDGTFNSKFLDKVEQEYKKYSNATASYINKIMLSGCAKQVDETFKSLQSEKNANVTVCLRNRLYYECGRTAFFVRVKNATASAELCGKQPLG